MSNNAFISNEGTEEFLYFVYAELLNYAEPPSGDQQPSMITATGKLLRYYSGTVSRDTPLLKASDFAELAEGLAKHFGVTDPKRIVIKSLSRLA